MQYVKSIWYTHNLRNGLIYITSNLVDESIQQNKLKRFLKKGTAKVQKKCYLFVASVVCRFDWLFSSFFLKEKKGKREKVQKLFEWKTPRSMSNEPLLCQQLFEKRSHIHLSLLIWVAPLHHCTEHRQSLNLTQTSHSISPSW